MTKEKVLEMLTMGQFVSGQEMSQRLGLSRAAVWKAINSLKQQGYVIESVSNKGYCLVKNSNNLCQKSIQTLLEGHPWQHLVQVLDTVDSTNNVVKKLSAEGAPQGTIVISDCQTAGRGRLGRQFASPKGVGVYLSLLLRPQVPPHQLLHLTAVSAVATVKAVEKTCGIQPGIKWTNDLVVGKEKLAGILTEMSLEAESGTVNYAVIGIGTNCNHQKSHFPPEVQPMATSLLLQTHQEVDRNQYAANLVEQLYQITQSMFDEKAQLMTQYAQMCITVGQAVKVVRGAEVAFATALGIDLDGGLLVRYDSGEEAVVNSGEVSVRGMYGYL